MNTQALRNDTDLHQMLAIAAAVFATAGGLIHLTVTRHHLDFPIVVAGFVLMGVAQWVFAFTILKRPTTVIANTGGMLHAAIVAVWILSRTTGLAFVPGAEHVASVGVADIVATTFSVAVIGTVVMWRALSGSTGPVNVPNPGVRTVVAALAIGAGFLTVPAIAAPHHHLGSHLSTDTDDGHTHEAENTWHEPHHHETLRRGDDGHAPAPGTGRVILSRSGGRREASIDECGNRYEGSRRSVLVPNWCPTD